MAAAPSSSSEIIEEQKLDFAAGLGPNPNQEADTVAADCAADMGSKVQDCVADDDAEDIETEVHAELKKLSLDSVTDGDANTGNQNQESVADDNNDSECDKDVRSTTADSLTDDDANTGNQDQEFVSDDDDDDDDDDEYHDSECDDDDNHDSECDEDDRSTTDDSDDSESKPRDLTQYLSEDDLKHYNGLLEQMRRTEGFHVNVDGIPLYIQRQLVHPVDIDDKYYKPKVERIAKHACEFINDERKGEVEVEFSEVIKANKLSAIWEYFFVTFTAYNKLDKTDGVNGTKKFYQATVYVIDRLRLPEPDRFKFEVFMFRQATEDMVTGKFYGNL